MQIFPGGDTTADEVLADVEMCLRTYLPPAAVLADLGDAPITWQQVPTTEALQTATFPALAITSPGLADAPTRDGQGWNATWRVAIAMYDRGESYAVTAGRARTWAALIRSVLLRHLNEDSAVARDVVWVGEEYALRPEASSARTLGGAAVALDVTVRQATGIANLTIPHLR